MLPGLNILISGVFNAAVLFLIAAGLQIVFGVQKIVSLAVRSTRWAPISHHRTGLGGQASTSGRHLYSNLDCQRIAVGSCARADGRTTVALRLPP